MPSVTPLEPPAGEGEGYADGAYSGSGEGEGYGEGSSGDSGYGSDSGSGYGDSGSESGESDSGSGSESGSGSGTGEGYPSDSGSQSGGGSGSGEGEGEGSGSGSESPSQTYSISGRIALMVVTNEGEIDAGSGFGFASFGLNDEWGYQSHSIPATDEYGNFTFGGLAEGTYHVYVGLEVGDLIYTYEYQKYVPPEESGTGQGTGQGSQSGSDPDSSMWMTVTETFVVPVSLVGGPLIQVTVGEARAPNGTFDEAPAAPNATVSVNLSDILNTYIDRVAKNLANETVAKAAYSTWEADTDALAARRKELDDEFKNPSRTVASLDACYRAVVAAERSLEIARSDFVTKKRVYVEGHERLMGVRHALDSANNSLPKESRLTLDPIRDYWVTPPRFTATTRQ